LVHQDGQIETVKKWVGLAVAPGGWVTERRASADYLRKELIYSGVVGNTIEISYREFRGGMAAPAFFQNARYDLTESRTIRFQNFQIEVASASNQGFVGKLLSDNPGFTPPASPSAQATDSSTPQTPVRQPSVLEPRGIKILGPR
jgi:hypothetical protein